jgi:flavodoxin
MKNALIVYSKTGNTLAVAKRLNEVLEYELLSVTALSDDPNQTFVSLVETPDVSVYPHIIFAAQTHAFRLSKVMQAYLNQLESLAGKTVDLLVTHYFPFAFLGGNQTIKQMKKMVEFKGGTVLRTFCINWRSKKREQTILSMIETYREEKAN